jgi:hypothetical protein
MKILLACLMCLVLGASECFAIDGGPFGGGSQVTVTGTYAGVFVPVIVTLSPGPPPVTAPPDNSLALFTMTIPKQGLASGTVAIFRNGKAYPGTMTASADPDSAQISGVISAIHSQSVTSSDGSTTVTFVFDDLANGILKAKIVANTTTTSTASARIRGAKSSITYTTGNTADPSGDSGGPVFYHIRGFKQSEATG